MSSCNRKLLKIQVQNTDPKSLAVSVVPTLPLKVSLSFDPKVSGLSLSQTTLSQVSLTDDLWNKTQPNDILLCSDIWFVSKNIDDIFNFIDNFTSTITTSSLLQYPNDIFNFIDIANTILLKHHTNSLNYIDTFSINIEKQYLELLVYLENIKLNSNKYISEVSDFNTESCNMYFDNYIESSYFTNLYVATHIPLIFHS